MASAYTDIQHGLLDITGLVEKDVEQANVNSGIGCVYCPHTTAAITVYSGVDPLGPLDINDTLKILVPTRTDFHHQCAPHRMLQVTSNPV